MFTENKIKSFKLLGELDLVGDMAYGEFSMQIKKGTKGKKIYVYLVNDMGIVGSTKPLTKSTFIKAIPSLKRSVNPDVFVDAGSFTISDSYFLKLNNPPSKKGKFSELDVPYIFDKKEPRMKMNAYSINTTDLCKDDKKKHEKIIEEYGKRKISFVVSNGYGDGSFCSFTNDYLVFLHIYAEDIYWLYNK